MSNLVPPHGSDSLQPLLLPESERAEELERAATHKKVPMSSREVSDLLMLGMGAYTPLSGFMGEADWRSCCENMTLAGGLFWPIPITLSCSQELGDSDQFLGVSAGSVLPCRHQIPDCRNNVCASAK